MSLFCGDGVSLSPSPWPQARVGSCLFLTCTEVQGYGDASRPCLLVCLRTLAASRTRESRVTGLRHSSSRLQTRDCKLFHAF